MATNPTPTGTAPSLVDRAKNMILTPKTEWPVIDAEPATIGGIYRNYVVFLAAIGPIAMAIGLLLMGSGFFRFPIGFVIGQAVLSYLLSLVGVYVLALIIEALAPTFGGTKDRLAAFKLAAYSMTAVWLAGIVLIVPLLGIVALVGLIYTLYLLWIGLPVMMKSPADKTAGYAISAIVAYIVVYFVISMIASRIMWTLMPPVSAVTFNLPG
jgi:polyferredoxin